ncbi:hypothetical protein [Microbacterium gallinarum]|uniref:Uncharacterized protein n=1 Tax=Microbacterium gallinarum TaxID=2762209 RepID=A0ABR8X2U6_9MICO|nr:hypothetical protein [Microbacterium gallinarum]MBD8023216.1 hypothetical protein [Microbacterium gallinarum]
MTRRASPGFDIVLSSDAAENVRTPLVIDVRVDAAQRTLSTAEALGVLCHRAASGDSDAQESLLKLVGADYYAYLTRFARDTPDPVPRPDPPRGRAPDPMVTQPSRSLPGEDPEREGRDRRGRADRLGGDFCEEPRR